MRLFRQYRKLITAVVGLGLFLLRTETEIGPEFLDYLVAILTAAGVYGVPNEPTPQLVGDILQKNIPEILGVPNLKDGGVG